MPRGNIKADKAPKKVKLGVKVERYETHQKKVSSFVDKPSLNSEIELSEKVIDVRNEDRENEVYTPKKIEAIKTISSPREKDLRQEKKKEFIMWSGVSLCMMIIIGAWLWNTKQVFETARANNANQPSAIDDLRKVSDEIGRQVEEARIKEESLAASSTEATSTLSEVGIVGKLPNSEVAVSSSTSSISSILETVATSTK